MAAADEVARGFLGSWADARAELDAIALEQAYHRADQALYRATQRGRNRVVTASEVGDDPVQQV